MKLFEPGKIGEMEVKNRIVMSAIGIGRMANADGKWGKRVLEYYIARARGGVGLITSGLIFISQKLEPFARHHFDLYSDSHLESLNRIAIDIHAYGAKLSVQLTAGFGRVLKESWQKHNAPPICASAIPCYFNPQVISRAINTHEAEELAQTFGSAAKRCKMADVDVVELHGHEGYLMDQFMSEIWNHRNDKYGGSKERRLTFAKEAVSAIKREAGKDFPVIYRFGVSHYLDNGRSPQESLWIARQLEAMGVDALHVDAGCYETSWWAHPPTYQPPGCMVDMAEKVKKVVKVPVIAVGKLHYPALAEKVLQESKADFIAIGRGLLADPDWPNKVKDNKYEDIIPCIGDHDGCCGELRQNRATSCTVNPTCGHEKEWPLKHLKTKKSLLIIGGGPAGMEAARVGALREFTVTLWEKTDRLGGNLWPASEPIFKKDLRDFMEYQISQLKKLPVRISYDKKAIPEDVLGFGADYVILCTGSYQKIPRIPGGSDKRVISATDLLLNKGKLTKRILVVGGGLIGCETAIYLAQEGHQVILASRRSEILTDVIQHNRLMLLKMVADHNIQVMSSTVPLKLTTSGILVKQGNKELILPSDSLVFGGYMYPQDDLLKNLNGKIAHLYAIGDCIKPRRIINAIWEAFHAVRSIGK